MHLTLCIIHIAYALDFVYNYIIRSNKTDHNKPKLTTNLIDNERKTAMVMRRFKVAVNSDINNASSRPVTQNIPESVGTLGEKLYYHLPMGWKIDNTIRSSPIGTANIHNNGSRMDGCRRTALVLTADIAVFLCSTDNYKSIALVKDGKAIIVTESPNGYFDKVECNKDTVTTVINLREYLKCNTVSWETLESMYQVYDWEEIKADVNYLFLVGGVA